MKLKQIKSSSKRQLSELNNFFDDSYSKVYSELLKIELDEQTNFLKANYFKKFPKSNFKILDLCCGTGRHIKSLNNYGYVVDGVDINPEALKVAQEKSKKGNFYLSDVQFFKPDKKYNLIYSMESSIGYLSDSENVQIFKNISDNLLIEDGIFVLHLANRDYLLKNMSQRMWFGNNETGYLLEDRLFEIEKGILKINQVRIIDGVDKRYSIDLRLYSLKELEYLLNEAGLTILRVYGNYKNEPYDINQPYMLVECSKKCR